MKFHGRSMVASNIEQRNHGEAMCEWLKLSEFESPNHLMDELRNYARRSKQPWTVRHHAGSVHVQGSFGILVSIRPTS